MRTTRTRTRRAHRFVAAEDRTLSHRRAGSPMAKRCGEARLLPHSSASSRDREGLGLFHAIPSSSCISVRHDGPTPRHSFACVHRTVRDRRVDAPCAPARRAAAGTAAPPAVSLAARRHFRTRDRDRDLTAMPWSPAYRRPRAALELPTSASPASWPTASPRPCSQSTRSSAGLDVFSRSVARKSAPTTIRCFAPPAPGNEHW